MSTSLPRVSPVDDSAPFSCRVLVVGGGVAGVSAAHHLCRRRGGLRGAGEVVLLEARSRLGGRAFTVEKGGHVLELGAQWLLGGCPANSMFNLCNSFSLLGDDVQRTYGGDGDLLRWPHTSGFVCTSDGAALSEEASKAAHEIFNAVRDEAVQFYRRQYLPNRQNGRILRDRTRLLAFYNARTRKAMDALREEKTMNRHVLREVESALSGFRNSLSLLCGEDPEVCRLELVGAPRDLPGGDVRVPSGVCAAVEAMARELPPGCVRTGRRVSLIDWSLLSRAANVMDKVVVEAVVDERGGAGGGRQRTEVFHADYVISTIPLAVLRRCHQQIFYPGLDQQKIESLHRVGVGHLAKLHLEWERPWWARGEGGLSLAWDPTEMKTRRLPRDWVRWVGGFSEVEGQPGLLVCWVAGDGARVVDQLDDEEIATSLTALLQTFTGDPGLPPPRRLYRHAWSEDPLALSSVSLPTMSTEPADFDALAAPLPSAADPRLLFAGEATAGGGGGGGGGFGTLHGARLSGVREADRVMDRMLAVDRMARELGRISIVEVNGGGGGVATTKNQFGPK